MKVRLYRLILLVMGVARVDSDRCLRLELSELAEVVSRVDSSLAMTWTNRNNNTS